MKPKLTVATSYPIVPARGGGQQRVLGLYGAAAARGVDVDVVALTDLRDHATVRSIAPGLREIRVPKTPAHDRAELAMHNETGIPVTDVALAVHHELTPAYADALRESASDAAAVIACHPFTEPALAAACPERPLIYEAQDVETDLKAEMLNGRAADVLDIVRSVERACCERASIVLTCSNADASRLHELLGADLESTIVVPNGCDCEHMPHTGPAQRAAVKRSLGIEALLALFVGSWHEPNLVAARAVLAAAESLPDARFVIVGSAGSALIDDRVPANVDITGPVDANFLRTLLGIADLALNPMRSGSGTNLKMLDYAAAGIPLISSAVGARGLGFEPGEHYARCDPDDLASAIAAFADEPAEETARRARIAYDRVVSVFDWRGIASRWLEHAAMERLLSR
jgi:glycosyltransferase involved in cell wall biosynthesis